jgi:hypothetical protein
MISAYVNGGWRSGGAAGASRTRWEEIKSSIPNGGRLTLAAPG